MKKLMAKTAAAALALSALGISAADAGGAGKVYVPLGNSGELAVIDPQADAVTSRLSSLPAVHGLAGTPDGRFLIAGSYEEREAGAAIADKPAAISEEDHAAHHGALPAGVRDDDAKVGTVAILGAEEGAVLRTIDVAGGVHHVAASPDGSFAVVTHPGKDSISAIDLRSYEVIANLSTGPAPNYAAFSPDGSVLYVSNTGNDTVTAIDTGRWATSWSVTVGASPEHMVLSPAGAELYVNNVDDGSVSVIGTGTRKVLKTIPIGETLHGIDLSDDGKTLFVAALGDDKLVAYDLAAGTYRSARLEPGPYHLTAIRSTGKIYVSSTDEPKLWVVGQDGLAVLGEIPVGGKGHQMVLGPGK